MTKALNPHDSVYSDLLRDVIKNGRDRSDRTGTGTRSVFGRQARFDLTQGFPLLTGKKVNFSNIWTELYWFLKGDTNVAFLQNHNNPIWNEWANEEGELGPVYGAQWRSWPTSSTCFITANEAGYEEHELEVETLDQIQNLIDGLRNNPYSRRHIVSGWNPAVLPIEGNSHADNVNAGRQALPPCHTMFQFYVVDLTLDERMQYALNNRHRVESDMVAEDIPGASMEKMLDEMMIPKQGLSCQLYQRSGDIFLGVPYNIASYALLTYIVAEMCGMIPMEFVHTFGDLHLYHNHFAQADQYLKQPHHHSPMLDLSNYLASYDSVDELLLTDVKLVGYVSGPFIKAPVAV